MHNKQLIKRAVIIFPRTDYTDSAQVRHARRKWLECVQFLRSQRNGSIWVIDNPVPAQKYQEA